VFLHEAKANTAKSAKKIPFFIFCFCFNL
jgi:hypothetical protein